MARRSVSGLLQVDFFTHEYRISAHMSVMGKTVGDVLNDRLHSYVQLNDVYISRIRSPGEIVASYAEAQIRKDGLLFAVVPVKESLSKAGRATSYFGRQRRKVWLALPMFEIEGDFQLTGLSQDWKTYLAKALSDYVPILDAVARLSVQPEITFAGEAFLVSRAQIDLFCMEGEPE
jgi:hypothetical protein